MTEKRLEQKKKEQLTLGSKVVGSNPRQSNATIVLNFESSSRS